MEPGAPLRICSARLGPWAVVRLEGELDSSTDSDLEEAVLNLLSSGASLLAFDVSDLGFSDSSGLSVFIKTRARLLEREGRMAIVGAGGIVRKAFEVTGLNAIFELVDTLDQLESFSEFAVLPEQWIG